MSSKCTEYDCEYNIPVNKLRSNRQSTRVRHSSGHSKNFKKISFKVSGRCLFGADKRREKCKFDEEEEKANV